ncbi:hypothetical protein IGI04_008719, partial [Brassica rapa subsp. trilocularis]
MTSSTSSSPCAACKFLRRKCTQECVFAPYFPPDQPHKFAYVHKIFGASNVAKLLNDLASNQREDAVNSLFYEAEARLRDPVYGCIGLISILQHRLKQLQHDLDNAKKELAAYVAPNAMFPMHHPQPHFMSLPPQPQQPSSASSSASVLTQQQQHLNLLPVAYGGGSISPHHHHNQPQFDILRFNSGFGSVPTGSVTVTGFNQLSSSGTTITGMSPSLALGISNYNINVINNNLFNSYRFKRRSLRRIRIQRARRVEGVSLVHL